MSQLGLQFCSASEIGAENVYNSSVRNYISSIEDCTKAIKLNPKNAKAYTIRGFSKQKLKDYQGAIDDYTKAIQLNPNNEAAYLNRGVCKYEMANRKNQVAGTNKLKTSSSIPVNTVKKADNQPQKIVAISTDEKSGLFKPYMDELQKNIKKNWAPPSSRKSAEIVVFFTIDKIGNLNQIRLHKSSDEKSMDVSAISAIMKSSPFQPLPAEFKGEKVDIYFTFTYKAYKNENLLF